MINAIKEKDINKIANNLHNDFEYSICKQYPLINEIKKKMIDNGALNTLMSGSGSTVFSIYNDYYKALDSLKELENT